MNVSTLPTINALLNATAACLLLWGYVMIRRGHRDTHKKIMLSALVVSAAFLMTYLIYHAQVGSVPYAHYDWTRPVYFAILIPHIILAGLMVPFIITLVVFALRGNFTRHKRLARWVWPVWMFVSVSGVAVYLMLYHL